MYRWSDLHDNTHLLKAAVKDQCLSEKGSPCLSSYKTLANSGSCAYIFFHVSSFTVKIRHTDSYRIKHILFSSEDRTHHDENLNDGKMVWNSIGTIKM